MAGLTATHCAIENCRTTVLNKPPGVSFHPCPTNHDLRKRWLRLLKNRCSVLDWHKSQICSKHFEPKYFDSQRMLKDNAVPTLFAPVFPKIAPKPSSKGVDPPRSKVDRLLKKLTQAELTADIKMSMSRLKEPADLDAFVNDDLRCRSDAPKEAILWLMVKKQEHLNNRLMELVVQTKKHVEILQNDSEEAKSAKKAQEQRIENLNYVVKCLQEKHASLEEQIEILTAVESR